MRWLIDKEDGEDGTLIVKLVVRPGLLSKAQKSLSDGSFQVDIGELC